MSEGRLASSEKRSRQGGYRVSAICQGQMGLQLGRLILSAASSKGVHFAAEAYFFCFAALAVG